MKIITFANRKGGAGKSTCAAHFALEAIKEEKKVILIDLDPQKSLETWWSNREDENPYLADISSESVKDKINSIREKGFDLCIIDTPGDLSLNAKMGIELADLVIIPSKATSTDLAAIGRSISIVTELKKQFIFIVTQVTQRSNFALQTVSLLSEFGPVAPSTITNRQSYVSAMGEGVSAGVIDKKAKDELEIIWEFIKRKLYGAGKDHGKEKV